MNEKELLFRISRIVHHTISFGEAIEKIGVLFERELGGKGLIVREQEDGVSGLGGAAATAELFFEETAHLTSRSLYAVALRANGQTLGRLTAFFACAEENDGLRQRVTTFAGEQLGIMLERLRLTRRRRQLRSEIAKIRTNLATRKALQRAEGILGKRGWESDQTRLWMKRESAKQGLSLLELANAIFEQDAERVDEPIAVRLTA